MRRLITIWIALAFPLAPYAHAAGDDTLDAYAYHLALKADSRPFERVVLPSTVYEHVAHADLRDVRVFNAAGEIVPYAFVPPLPAPAPVARTALAAYPLRVDATTSDLGDFTLSLRTGPGTTTLDVRARDGRAVPGVRVAGLVLDASALEAPIHALVVTLPAGGDVNARLRVEASDDLATWRTLASGAPILRLGVGGQTLVRDRIPLPGVRARYFRISAGDGLPMIELAGVEAETGAPPAPRTLPARDLVGTYVEPGAFEYDASGPFDVAEINLRLAAPNTVVPGQVLVRSDPKEPWRRLTDAVFYRLGEGSSEVTNPPLATSGAAYRYWRVQLDPRSGVTSASPPALVLGWQPAQIVFTSRGPAPFELAFGRRDVAPGALPIAVLVPGFDARTGLTADAGVATADGVPQLGNRSALGVPVDFRRAALWTVLVVTVVVLGVLGVRLLRQPSPPPGPQA